LGRRRRRRRRRRRCAKEKYYVKGLFVPSQGTAPCKAIDLTAKWVYFV
jgi:hypothetical protein